MGAKQWMAVGAAASWAAPALALVPGDVNGDGQVTVADALLAATISLQAVMATGNPGAPEPAPGCVAAVQALHDGAFALGWAAQTTCPLTSPMPAAAPWVCADVNADGVVNVSDVMLCVHLALQLALDPALDADGSGAPDAWEVARAQLETIAKAAGSGEALAHGQGCGAGCPAGMACCGGACEAETTTDACAVVDCDDQNACTVDSCVDGECVHVGVECDDGISCTIDYCDPAVGCGAWPEDLRCADEGGVCRPQESTQPSGCVDGEPLQYCKDANLQPQLASSDRLMRWCGVSPPHDGALWSPPQPGHVFECDFSFAAVSPDCVDPYLGCFTTRVVVAAGWTDDVVLDAIFVRYCEDEGGPLEACGEWIPPFYEAGELLAKAPGPFASRYLVSKVADLSELGPGDSVVLTIRPHYDVSPVLPDGTVIWPYVDDGFVHGDPYRLTMRFRYIGEGGDGSHSKAKLRACLGKLNVDSIIKNYEGALDLERFDDETFVTVPKQGMVCIDEKNHCLVGTLTPGEGCSFEPKICPSDGFSCTESYCVPTSGYCGQKPDQIYCAPGRCLLTSPFTDPETGCVDPMWEHVCWDGGVLCDGSDVFEWHGEYGPAAGEYVRCAIQIARGVEVCEHLHSQLKHCAPHAFSCRFATDTTKLEVVGLYSEMCFPGVGCYTLPLWDGTSDTYPLPTGHSVLITPPSPDGFNLGSHGILWAFMIGPATLLNEAYLAGDGVTVVGDPHVLDMWFRRADGHDPSQPVPICYSEWSSPSAVADWMRNDDGVFIYPAPASATPPPESP